MHAYKNGVLFVMSTGTAQLIRISTCVNIYSVATCICVDINIDLFVLYLWYLRETPTTVTDVIDSYSVRQETSTDGEPQVLRLAVKSVDKKGSQLWYEDRDSVLHSQFDDLVIDVSTSQCRPAAADTAVSVNSLMGTYAEFGPT